MPPALVSTSEELLHRQYVGLVGSGNFLQSYGCRCLLRTSENENRFGSHVSKQNLGHMHTSVWSWTPSLGIWDVGPRLPEQRGALPWGIPLEQWAAVETSLTPTQWSQCDVFSTAEREKTDVLLFLYYLWGGSSEWCPRSWGSSVLHCFNSIAVVLLDKRCSFPNRLTMCLCTLLKARTCCLFCVQPAILRATKCATSSTTSL